MSDTTVTDEATSGEGESEEPAAPADELREGQLAQFTEALGDQVLGSHIVAGRELWVRVDRTAWVAAAELAKTKLGCTFFDFLSAIDWMPSPWGRYEDALIDKLGGPDANGEANAEPPPAATTGNGIPYVDPASIKQGYAGGETRIQLICRVSDVRKGHSVVLKTDVADDDPTIATLTGVWAGANWHERECWEMFGVTFTGHPGLRHLYLPGAFEGNPLRKDFPLLARLVKPWPGIVDVEPMPGGDDEPAEGEATEGGTTTEAAAETTAPAETTGPAETTAPGDATGEVEAEAAEGHAESDADPEATAESAETATEVEAEAAADTAVEAEAEAEADATAVTDEDAAASGAADANVGATAAAAGDDEAVAAAKPTADETDPEAGAS